jgi:hypothetical protein
MVRNDANAEIWIPPVGGMNLGWGVAEGSGGLILRASDMQRDLQQIAERLRREGLMPISRAAKLVQARRGRRGHVSTSTLIRWIVKGKAGVFLDGILFADEGWWTSAAALWRFAAQLTEQHLRVRKAIDMAVTSESSAERRDRERRATKAIEELRELRREGRRIGISR